MANGENMIIGAGQDTAHRAPKINTITCGDCLEVMQAIPDKSINMILCDVPYGTTACKWDFIINPITMFTEYKRICMGIIALTSLQPFSTVLINAGKDIFKYSMVWDKKIPSGMSYARFQPMRQHEDILIFGKGIYNPQVTKRDKPIVQGGNKYSPSAPIQGRFNNIEYKKKYDTKQPTTILIFDKIRKGSLHPTQKPVPLFEYLIRTYTNEGDTVLDNCIGSGTTAIACINTGRNYIGIEKEEKYCRIAEERIHALRSPAQNTKEICHTAPNSASMQNAQVEMDLL
jgi:site-specific DNA-methyltransferase (adenine-specific)